MHTKGMRKTARTHVTSRDVSDPVNPEFESHSRMPTPVVPPMQEHSPTVYKDPGRNLAMVLHFVSKSW